MDFRKEDGPRGPRFLLNGKSLVSAYAPAKEARQWAEGLTVSAQSLVFLAGEPEGLAAAELEARTACRVVRLFPHRSCLTEGNNPWCWAPGTVPLEEYLRSVFDRCGPSQVQWQVWPAFERAAPAEALLWTQVFRDVYRIAQGSWLTTKHSGRQWWRNALRNYLGWERPARYRAGTRPIVVAASGPSLDDGWETLLRRRDYFELWALPSSFSALRKRGLQPDVAVATDGGYWAREHLRQLSGVPTVFFSALSGAADPVLEQSRTVFFGQGLPWEAHLLATLPLPPLVVPSQGTVAVTALNLALAATSGQVYVAGLDLAWRDYRGHVSGHTVENRLAPTVGRFEPWESLFAARCFAHAPLTLAPGVRTSAGMRTYALWLGGAERFSRSVTRVAPSAVDWAGMPTVSWAGLDGLLASSTGRNGSAEDDPLGSWPTREKRRDLAAASLEALVNRTRAATMAEGEFLEWASSVVPDEVQAWQRNPEPEGWEAIRVGFLAFVKSLGAAL